jgi:two-component system, OmpR family, sensor histidine kinase MprB
VSLRARLALVAASAVALSVVLASMVVFFLVRNELRGQVDATLQNQVQQISLQPGVVLATAVPGSPNQYELHIRPDLFANPYQVVGSDGRTYRPDVAYNVLQPQLPGASQAQQIASGKGSVYLDSHYRGQAVRILMQPSANHLFTIEVAASIAGLNHELAKIRLWLLLVALGGIGFAAVAGFFVARTTLAPLRELSETAERVRRTRDLTQRIQVSGSDELSQLATTFNAMLESLDAAAQRQSQLVQDASHELRTPLTSLRTNIEVLAGRAGELPPEERENLLRDVLEQLGEMTAVVAELTELARGAEQEQPVEDVRLDLVTEDAIRRTERNHPEVPIEAQLEETTVSGVPANLERAIANLLDNAAKWSPAGVPVDVRLSGGELSVRDHGPGIAEADLPHVFERFYRATAARSMPGSGLGLSIVQKVAEAHGGTVTAERPPDGGTLMRLRVTSPNGSNNGSDNS